MESTTFRVISGSTAVFLTAAGVWWYRRVKWNTPPEKWEPVGKVEILYLYPLKSGRRTELKEAECTRFGLIDSNNSVYQLRDRSLIVYKEDGNYTNCLANPSLVLVEVAAHDSDYLKFDAPNMRTLFLPIPNNSVHTIRTIKTYGGEYKETIDCGDEAASWISRYLTGKNVGYRIGYNDGSLRVKNFYSAPLVELKRLYKMLIDEDQGIYSYQTGYALYNKDSIDDLNSKLDEPVSIIQFRPNIYISGPPAYAEEKWDWVKIGDEALFRNVKPCTRCLITTIDPDAEENDKIEEIPKGRKYSKESKDSSYSKDSKESKNNKQARESPQPKVEMASPVMGILMGLRATGKIHVGDTVYIGIK